MKDRPRTPAAVRNHGAHVARLLAELAHGGLLGRLALVDQAGRQLDDHPIGGRAELLLEQQLGPRRLLEDGDDLDGVDGAALGLGGALGGLPGSQVAPLVMVGDLLEAEPLCVLVVLDLLVSARRYAISHLPPPKYQICVPAAPCQ